MEMTDEPSSEKEEKKSDDNNCELVVDGGK